MQIILDTFDEPIYIELSEEDSIAYLRGQSINIQKYYVAAGINIPASSLELADGGEEN